MFNGLIGRTPIYTPSLDLYGYEIGLNGSAGRTYGVESEQQLIELTHEISVDRLTCGYPAIVHLPQVSDRLVQEVGWSRDQLVFSLPANWAREHSRGADEALCQLAKKGYRIGLSQPSNSGVDTLADAPAFAAWWEVRAQSLIAASVDADFLRKRHLPIFARCIDTNEQYQSTVAAGADYLHGSYFERPKASGSDQLSANRLAAIQLMARLQDPDLDVRVAEDLVSQDVTLSYKLLRLVNSAFFGLTSSLDSIRRAVIFLGLQRLRNWATLILMSAVDFRPREILVTGLVRARTCELLATRLERREIETYYMVGLFSIMDALVDAPANVIFEKLGLRADLRDAMLHGTGPLGELLREVIALEHKAAFNTEAFGLTPKEVTEIFLDAVRWAFDVQKSLASA